MRWVIITRVILYALIITRVIFITRVIHSILIKFEVTKLSFPMETPRSKQKQEIEQFMLFQLFPFYRIFLGSFDPLRIVCSQFEIQLKRYVETIILRDFSASIFGITKWLYFSERFNLKTLDLSFSIVLVDETLAYLCRFLYHFPKLQLLKINFCHNLHTVPKQNKKYKIEFGGSVYLCHLRHIYCTLDPIQFILTHIALSSYCNSSFHSFRYVYQSLFLDSYDEQMFYTEVRKFLKEGKYTVTTMSITPYNKKKSGVIVSENVAVSFERAGILFQWHLAKSPCKINNWKTTLVKVI